MKNYVKKGVAIVLALAMVFAFASCGKKAEEATGTQSGLVVACEGGELSIYTASKQLLTFNIENAPIECEDTIGIDDYAQVDYEGEIKDGDTAECKVTKVTVQPAEEQEINGTVKKLEDENNYVTIKTKENDTYGFDITDAKKNYKNGIKVGNKVEIIYTGEIVDDDTSLVHVRSITDNDENKKEEKEAKNQVKVTNVHETVYVTANDVAVKAANDLNSKRIGTVNKKDKLTRTGVLSDGWSRVSYKGGKAYIYSKYLSTKKPSEPKTTTATTKKKTTTMVGTVIEVNDGVLYMDTPVGNEFEFSLKGAKVYTELEAGDDITVVFEGNEAQPGKLLKVY